MSDDFELKLSQPLRSLPPDWQTEILQAARREPSRTGQPLWRELLWPCPQAWAVLSVVWILILCFNLTTHSVPKPSGRPLIDEAQAARLFDEQERLGVAVESLNLELSLPSTKEASPPSSHSQSSIGKPNIHAV